MKAWKKKYPILQTPNAICISMEIKKDPNEQIDHIVFYPKLEKIESLIQSKALIVLAHIGTGRTAKKLMNWANNLKDVESHCFSLIVSKTAAESEDWSNVTTLGIINREHKETRSILPWISTRDEF